MDVSTLHGKAVLVTGAASGIGRATCLRLARDARARGRAAAIAAVDVGPAPGLETLKRELEAVGGEMLALDGDMGSAEAPARVVEAAAVVREDAPGDRRLVAYVVTDAAPEAGEPESERLVPRLRLALSERLPDYMLPSAYVRLDRLPARIQPFAFDADDSALLESFVSQAALSIRNAQLYRDTDQQRRRLQSLVEVSHRLSRGLDLSEVLDAITEAAAAIFEGEAGLRLLVGDELVRASVSRGARQRPSMERITTVGGLIGEVLRTGQPASTPDVSSEARIPTTFREILQHDRMTALLVTPIRHDERVLGTLHIYRERGHEWREDAHLLAAGLADQAVTAIENATRYAGLQDSMERAKIPARVNQLLTAALDLDVLLREIAGAAVTITGADHIVRPICGEPRARSLSRAS